MDAMTILRRCRSGPDGIRRTEQRIRQRRQAAEALPSPSLRDGSRGGGREDRAGRMAAEIDGLERTLKRQREEHAVISAAACALMDRLPERESAVLYGYYVSGETVAGLSRRLHFSDGYVRKLKGRGERLLQALSAQEIRETVPAWFVDEKGE